MIRAWLAGNAFLLIVVQTASAQEPGPVTPSFSGTTWVGPSERIALALKPPADAARVAVFIGDTDYSAMFDRLPDRLVFRARVLNLPPGEQDVTVYQVGADSKWQEVGRFPLRVLTPGGFQSVAMNPRLAVNNKGQVAEGHSPVENAPQRDEYQDYAVNTGLQTRHVRSGWSFSTQSNFAGVSNKQEALRFGELQNDAPKFDLSDYLITVERGSFNLTAGHVAFGENRHLLNGFASRGVRTETKLGAYGRLAAGALNGNSIVGWANPFGLKSPDHRILASSLSLTPFPARPQILLQGTLVNGSILPRSGFTQGAVLDAEKSTGTGLRLTAADAAQRVQIDVGYSRSSFTNPTDEQLEQGIDVVRVKRVTRYARYVDASAHLLRGRKILAPTTLTLAVQHERVDPLYRNVASPVSADIMQTTVTAQGSMGPVALQASFGRMHDNLGDIVSILTTHTHNSAANVALPLPTIFIKAHWLPTLTYGITRLRQFGDGVPPNSDFTETHVPDQVSINQTYGVEWQRTKWRLSYQRNSSDQDNRQIGRELADFLNTTNNVAVSWNALRALDLSADFGFDDAENKEQSQNNRTRRIGASVNWRPTSSTVVAGSFARTSQKDDPLTTEQTSTDLRAEVSQRFPLLRLTAGSSPGQLFVRFARQSGDLFNPFTPRNARHNWNVNTGLTIGIL